MGGAARLTFDWSRRSASSRADLHAQSLQPPLVGLADVLEGAVGQALDLLARRLEVGVREIDPLLFRLRGRTAS